MDRPVSLSLRSVDLASERAFKLGRALIDPQAHEYVIGDEATRLQPQTLKVLVALHDKSGHVVTRDELIDRCWNGRIVGDDVINRCISLLRPVATKSGGFRIETIPRSGYRLVEVPNGPKRPVGSHILWLSGAMAAALVVAIGTAALISRSSSAAAAPALVEIEALKAAPDDPAALALSDGMGPSIEQDLAGSGTPVEIVDADADKDVPLRLRGSSVSDDGTLRASLQLTESRSGNVIWAATFQRPASEFDQLQDQISLQVARVLHCAYADGRRPYFETDLEFAKLSLAHCDTIGRSADESVRLDTQIVERAPGFARGWAEFAMDSAIQSYDLPSLLHAAAERRAIALAKRALSLDPHQGLAYAAIGLAANDTASWLDKERLVRRALVADPKSPELHNQQSGQLGEIGRLQDSLNEAQISYRLDHFLPGKLDQLVWVNIGLGNLDDAQDEVALARRYHPDNPWWDEDAVLLGLSGRDPARALQLLTTRKVRITSARERALAAFLRWRIAPTDAARRTAIEAIEAAARDERPTGEHVDLLAVLGDLDGAYSLAARLPPSQTPDARWFTPDLAAFRADPRFMPLAASRGLVKIWMTTGLWPDFCRTGNKLGWCRTAAAAALRSEAKRNGAG